MTKKISQLPAATSVDTNDEFVINQDGTTKKLTTANQWEFSTITASNGSGISALNASNLTSGTVPSARIDGNYTEIDRTAAVFSHPTDTGSVSTTHRRAVVASLDSTASGSRSAVVASEDSTASGARSAVVASLDSTASGSRSAVVASNLCTASGTMSAVVASENSTASNAFCTVISSKRTLNNDSISLALGSAGSGSASTANRKIHLFGSNGNVSIAGTLTQSATFTDFAEMMPNGTGAEIEAGTLLTLDDGAVRPADEGEEICGVVSHTAAILAGDTPFCWQGRYLHDEFGRRLYEDMLDPDWEAEIADPDWDGEGDQPMIANPKPQPTITVLKENPDWNPELEQVTRSERPDEWTPVGLIGQVYVRLGEQVQAGDRITAKGGKGYKTTDRTGLKVMTVTKDFDADYGIARCLLNVMV